MPKLKIKTLPKELEGVLWSTGGREPGSEGGKVEGGATALQQRGQARTNPGEGIWECTHKIIFRGLR